MMRRPCRRQGFTLIEVLVALVIVAIGMAAVLGTLTSAADSTVYLRDKTLASWIASNRVTELRLAAARPAKGKSSGELQFAGRQWRYEQDVVPLEIPGLLRIDIRVAPTAETSQVPQIRRSKTPAWTATASGIVGAAVAPPLGSAPDWNGVAFNPGGVGPGGEQPPQNGQPPTQPPAPAPSPPPGFEPPVIPNPRAGST